MRLKSKEAREQRWLTIVKLHELGHSQIQIAATLEIHQSSVSRILSRHAKGEPLKEKTNTGAPQKLSGQQCLELKGIVLRGAARSGFESDFWTNKRIALVVKERFGIHFSPGGIRNVMKRLGFSKQRYQKKDKRQGNINKWKEEKLPEIKKNERPDEVIKLSG